MNRTLFSLILLSFSSWVNAHDFEDDGIYYKYNDGSGGSSVSVTFKGNSKSLGECDYSGVVVIPKTVKYIGKTYSVTSIETEAYIYTPQKIV